MFVCSKTIKSAILMDVFATKRHVKYDVHDVKQ